MKRTVDQRRLLIAMAEKGIGATELAENAGVSPNTVSRMCRRFGYQPRSCVLRAVAEALGLPVAELIEFQLDDHHGEAVQAD